MSAFDPDRASAGKKRVALTRDDVKPAIHSELAKAFSWPSHL
jgi:hypothetical protein